MRQLIRSTGKGFDGLPEPCCRSARLFQFQALSHVHSLKIVLLRCRPPIPDRVNTDGITDDPMSVLDAMDQEAALFFSGPMAPARFGKYAAVDHSLDSASSAWTSARASALPQV